MSPASPSVETVAFGRDTPFPLPVEQRYPLDLSVRIPELRRLYHESNATIWDVDAEFPSETAGTADLDPSTREAAALVWSRRAWLAFAGISESEAALVRCCIERDREADLKFVLAARGTEQAVAADASYRMAQRFGGYVSAPPSPNLSRLFASEPIRRALDQRVDFDAYLVAHFVVLAAIDRALLETAARSTSDPSCKSTLERLLVDSTRQQTVGLIYATARVPQLDSAQRRAVAANVIAAVDIDIGSGLRCSAFLDPDMPGAGKLRDAESQTAAAGLGAAPIPEQRQVAAAALKAVQADLGDLGINTDALPAVGD
jgi:hypothetical protein